MTLAWKKKREIAVVRTGRVPAVATARAFFFFFTGLFFVRYHLSPVGGKKKDVQVSNQRLVVGNWSMQEDQTDNLQSGNERFEGKEELRSVEYVRSFKKIRDDLQPRSRFGQKGKDPW